MAYRGNLCRIFARFWFVKTQKYLDAEKETEPVKGTGIIWENNGQPLKILHRAKADEDDEERLLGWHVNDDDNLLTVLQFSDLLS